MSPFHSRWVEPTSAVHHTASPRVASSQCSACTREANVEPCVCAIALGPLPVPDEERMNATSREEVS